jgi:hypothetical protein
MAATHRAKEGYYSITSNILKEKAKQLWDALLQYYNIKQLKRSNVWLEGFKKQYKIKEYV